MAGCRNNLGCSLGRSTDIRELELLLCSEIAKVIKAALGKGPRAIEVNSHTDYIVVRLWGCLLPIEKEMAESEQGYFDVKINRLKLAYFSKNVLVQVVTDFSKRKVTGFHYDINPKTDQGIMVFLCE